MPWQDELRGNALNIVVASSHGTLPYCHFTCQVTFCTANPSNGWLTAVSVLDATVHLHDEYLAGESRLSLQSRTP